MTDLLSLAADAFRTVPHRVHSFVFDITAKRKVDRTERGSPDLYGRGAHVSQKSSASALVWFFFRILHGPYSSPRTHGHARFSLAGGGNQNILCRVCDLLKCVPSAEVPLEKAVKYFKGWYAKCRRELNSSAKRPESPVTITSAKAQNQKGGDAHATSSISLR